jgi:tetratricopeptide (TPR) repeat protein
MKEYPLSKRAGQLLEGAVQAAPRDPEARYLYGQWLCANNKTTQCLSEIQQSLAFTPADNSAARIQIFLTLAGAEKQLNHPAQAEAAYKQAVEINRQQPSPNPAVTYIYAKFLLDHSREEETRPLVEEILKLAPNFGPARLQQARFLSKAGKLDAALKEGLEALNDPHNDPDDLRAIHAFLAKTFFALGKIEEAKVHQEWLKENLK